MAELRRISTCLWFDREAEEAAALYVSLLPGSSVDGVLRVGPGEAMPEGTAKVVSFTLAGAGFQAINGGPAFRPTWATSIVVACEDQAEIDRIWDALVADGGEEGQCGWLKDRWGFAWQVVPRDLPDLLGGDAAAAGRAFEAMHGMSRIDAAAIREARARG
jgi:predicted 3-demethylubiquinone-9 3-methyltransferase (glyoxalase superfamily)